MAPEGAAAVRLPLPRWALLAAGTFVCLLAAAGGTWAAFTASTTNSGNAIAAGSVALTDNDGGSGVMFSLTGLTPGQTTSRCIKVTYNGSLASDVRMYGTTGGTGLDAHLGVTVTRGSYSTDPGFSSCTNFTPDTSSHVSGQAPGVVYAGTLQDFPDSYAAGVVDPAASNPEDWRTGESHVYKIEVTQGDEPAAAGKNATQTFTWEARNEAGYKGTVLSKSSLVGYWRLGEASGTVADDIAGTSDGAYVGGPTLGQAGALSGDADTAPAFDGVDDRVEIPDSNALDLNGFSVEAWVYLTSYGTTSTYRTIMMKGASAAERNFGLWLTAGTNGQVHYSFGSGAGFQSSNSATLLPLNSWQHIVFVHQPGTKNQLYINGRLDAEYATTATPVTSTAPVWIGGAGSTYGFITGRVDEPAVYNAALSAAEVARHYLDGTGG